jgi:hypothetical protein
VPAAGAVHKGGGGAVDERAVEAVAGGVGDGAGGEVAGVELVAEERSGRGSLSRDGECRGAD